MTRTDFSGAIVAALAAALFTATACAIAAVVPTSGQGYNTAPGKYCKAKRAWDLSGKSVTPPGVVRCAIPLYPPEMRQIGQEGDVIARVLVDSAGVPDSASIFIFEQKGGLAFERAVRAALPHMRFVAASPGDATPVIVETSAAFTIAH